MVNNFYYEFLAEFKRTYYKDLLTLSHLVGGQVNINKLTYPNGSVDDEANFWGYVLEKDGRSYLLSCKDKSGQDIKLGDVFPIYPRNPMKVATKGKAYLWIKKVVSAKIRPVKTMEFKTFVDTLSSMAHSNPDHIKLMWFMTLTQMFDRANFRIATPAGFGKDSTVEIINSLIGKANTIENPTLAKLEFMSTNKLLAVNEVIDIKKSDWRIMEQFLLSTGAHKPEVTKHSRATAGGTTELIDISKLSLSLMYNDIDHYPNDDLYFDKVTKKAVLDRFPALRLHGEFTEPFNSIKDYDVKKYVTDHYAEYQEIVGNYEWFRLNLLTSYNSYDCKLLMSLPKRWNTNIGRLLKIIDVYCDSQEEFDKWVLIVNKAVIDYREMLKYPELLKKAHKELTGKEYEELHRKVKQIGTFADKNDKLRNYLKGERKVEDVAVHDIW